MTFPRRTDVARHLARKPRSLSKTRPDAIPVGPVPDPDQQSPTEILGSEDIAKVVRSAHTVDKMVNR